MYVQYMFKLMEVLINLFWRKISSSRCKQTKPDKKILNKISDNQITFIFRFSYQMFSLIFSQNIFLIKFFSHYCVNRYWQWINNLHINTNFYSLPWLRINNMQILRNVIYLNSGKVLYSMNRISFNFHRINYWSL